MIAALVAESNVNLRKSLREVLKVYLPRLVVEEAATADEVMRCVKAHAPDFLFMDVHLKGKNGLKLAREIKEKHPGIVICLFADYDLPEYRKIAYQHGVDYFLLKDSLSGGGIADLIESETSEKASGF